MKHRKSNPPSPLRNSRKTQTTTINIKTKLTANNKIANLSRNNFKTPKNLTTNKNPSKNNGHNSAKPAGIKLNTKRNRKSCTSRIREKKPNNINTTVANKNKFLKINKNKFLKGKANSRFRRNRPIRLGRPNKNSNRRFIFSPSRGKRFCCDFCVSFLCLEEYLVYLIIKAIEKTNYYTITFLPLF